MSRHIFTKISQPADHSLVIPKMMTMEVCCLVLEIKAWLWAAGCWFKMHTIKTKWEWRKERKQVGAVEERLVRNRHGEMFHPQAAESGENSFMPFFFFIWAIEKKLSSTARAWSMIPDTRWPQIRIQTSKHPSLVKSMKVQPKECQEKSEVYIFQAWQTMWEHFVPRAIRIQHTALISPIRQREIHYLHL